jgi:hypothetical protein
MLRQAHDERNFPNRKKGPPLILSVSKDSEKVFHNLRDVNRGLRGA